MRRSAVLLFAALACARPPAAVSAPERAPAPVPAARAVPGAIRWTRTSAEHRALLLQTYRAASEALDRLAAGVPAGTWAVITDADETLIDNSTYQVERAALDSGFTAESWNAWVRRRAATALPGAVEFTRHVRVLGGRVAVVTNRDESVCSDTRANLAAAGITFDLVLCQPAGAPGDKNPRFASVAQGTAAPGVPPLRVLMWVGDNIRDFPALAQTARDSADALAAFGRSYFVLPNPMYGSWEQNPMR